MNAKRANKPGGISTPQRFYPNRLRSNNEDTNDNNTYSEHDLNSYSYDSLPISGLCTLPRRGNKLAPPSLSVSFDSSESIRAFNSKLNANDDSSTNKFGLREESKSHFSVKSSDSGFDELSRGENDLNLQNAKNKLNLNFDQVNRPSKHYGNPMPEEYEKQDKEKNGNYEKTRRASDFICSSIDLPDDLKDLGKLEDEELSHSGSDVSVLELSSFIDKENFETGKYVAW